MRNHRQSAKNVLREWGSCSVMMVLCLTNPSISAWAGSTPVQLRPAQALQDGPAPLLPGTPGAGYAIPCVVDWDGDGRKDLLAGYQNASRIALYVNRGTDEQPWFTNFTILKTLDGADITLPSGGCGSPAPWVCDFDGDGRHDLLVGSGSDGTVWFYRNTSPVGVPSLIAGTQLRAGGALLSVGSRAAPFTTDWDQDGLPDLLCGSGDGYAYFFKNTNTAQSPLFTKAVKLSAGGADLYLGIRSVLRAFDWDDDGLRDLVCSSDTGVYWCRNKNSNTQPILESAQAISAPVSGRGLAPINTGGRMRLDLADWNNDGITDMLLGNLNGTVHYYEGYRFRVLAAGTRSAGRLTLQWDSADSLHYDVLSGSIASQTTNLAAASLPSTGKTTTWTSSTTASQQFFRVRVAR